MANIRDIALAAGVSVATVSRVLTKPDVVKKSTTDKVRAAIAALDYKPNAVASSLRRQRSDNIVVVVPHIDNPFYSGVIQGIENIAHDNRFKVLLGETQDRQDRLDHYAEMLLGKVADGLILLGSRLPTIVQEAIARDEPSPVPLVLACERFEGLSSPSVEIDNRAASAAATRHLIERGHKRIATITGPLDNTLGRDRLSGYRDALTAAKIAIDETLIVEGDFTIGSGFHAARRLMKRKNPPTAIFCASDEMAIGGIKAATDMGLRVPDDIAMTGFDDLRFAAYCTPTLTTVAQPTVEIGEVAMRLMMGLLADEASEPEHIVLPYQLVIRDSS
ncbi:LacI family DNA-binding transcriptional regulator [soil metagenome]